MTFTYKGQEWHWNGFQGFFFQPVGPRRTRERIVTESHNLYQALRAAAGYP
jgi:hypothetical protein